MQDRAGVVAALHEAGFDVPRQGDHYVTMRDPATEKTVAVERNAVRA